MLYAGWRPRRSLVFCAWGAEEPGIIGSREWVEVRTFILSLSCSSVTLLYVCILEACLHAGKISF